MKRFFALAALVSVPVLSGCSSSSSPDPTGGTPTQKHEAMFTCDESDLAPVSFVGPGFDSKTGKFTGAPLDSYVVHTTWLKLKADKQKEFFSLVAPILAALQTQKGLIGYSVATSAKCGTARTMGVWADHASVEAFVTEKPHAAAMAQSNAIGDDFATYVWDQKLDGKPPSWAEMVDTLNKEVEAE
jgi:quinol monooxygenase YgiN